LEQIVNSQLQKSAKTQKKHYDKHINNKMTYQVGDLVLIENFKKEIGHTSKFENEYIGPFQIIKRSDDALNYKIKSLNDKNEQWVHYNRLRKYHASKPANELTGPTLAKRGRPRTKPHVERDGGNQQKRTRRNQARNENVSQRHLRPRDHKNYKD
jgi:hypothetical protein